MLDMYRTPVLTAATGVSGGSMIISAVLIWLLVALIAVICAVVVTSKKKSSLKDYGPIPAAGPVEQVMQLKQLLDAGAITQEEFDRKIKELLDL